MMQLAVRWSKSLLKKFLSGLIEAIPSDRWATLMDRFATRPRINARAFFYFERLVNYLNRERTVRALAGKVWYRTTAESTGRYAIYQHVFDNCVTPPRRLSGVRCVSWRVNEVGTV